MTSIKDLETQIEGVGRVLSVLRDGLNELKANIKELKEQEKDKEPESLLGHWATHPKYGRGIIAGDKPDTFKEVRFTIRNDEFTDGADQSFIRVDYLTLDPVTLNTTEDFEKAPVGTIVEAPMYPKDVAVKTEDGWYRAGGMHAIAVEYMPTCRVIRWGNGQ